MAALHTILASKCSSKKLLQDVHAGKNKCSSHIFMSAARNELDEAAGHKRFCITHKHDSSNLSALPLESYDHVTKKKGTYSLYTERERALASIARSTEFKDQIMHSHSRMKKRAKTIKLQRITKSETHIHALKVMEE